MMPNYRLRPLLLHKLEWSSFNVYTVLVSESKLQGLGLYYSNCNIGSVRGAEIFQGTIAGARASRDFGMVWYAFGIVWKRVPS